MKRSKHSLSHYHLLTGNPGQLYPVANYEVLPGDTIQHRTSALIRMQPMAAPVMHPVTARFHNFEIPYRLIWGPEWGDSGTFEDFITGGKGNDDTQTTPTQTLQWESQTLHTGSVADYLGIPYPGPNVQVTVSALPFRAYFLVFNEYYRDQDLINELDKSASAIQTESMGPCYQIAWSKDYFTTARPWAQKGADITIPLGTQAPISTASLAQQKVLANDGNGDPAYLSTDSGNDRLEINPSPVTDGNPLYADLSNATAATINDWRRAFALQRYQEARAQYGSRYTEYLQYLGVNPADSRLQRPTYLGGSKQTVQFSEVLRTGDYEDATTETFGIGDMYGHGLAALRSKRHRKFFQEHSIVLSLMSVLPMPMYTQGMHRMHFRQDKEDYFQKELAQIGQQTIYNGEVYVDGTEDDYEAFGYQDRYSEYKHLPSTVHGEMRTTLNYWHMGREFSSRPALNSSFTNCDATNRIYNVTEGDKMIVMVNHSIQARRLVPKSAKSRIL